MMTNTKMSLFNKYKGVYKKHVVENVFWDDSKNITPVTGFEKNNKVTVFIPKNKNNLTDYVNPKDYVGYGWTFNKGDYIVKGNITESQVSGLNDLSNYDVFTITSIDEKDFGSSNMHHFMIQGE